MTGVEHDHLRPERRVLRWAEIGIDDAEIARRFGWSERWVAQVRFLADLDRSVPLDQPDASDRSDTSNRPADRLRLSNAGCSAGGVQGSVTRTSAAGSAAAPSSSRGSRTTPGTSWR
jgi:hypothetical protein